MDNCIIVCAKCGSNNWIPNTRFDLKKYPHEKKCGKCGVAYCAVNRKYTWESDEIDEVKILNSCCNDMGTLD